MGRKLTYERFVLWNDAVIDTNKKQTYIQLEERGLQFGDGVYEVIRIYKGNLHLLDPHLTRLYRSMDEIELTLPFSKAELITLLYKLLENNNFHEDGTVYLQVSRGVQARAHAFSFDVAPTIYAYISKKERPALWIEYGIRAISEPDARWLRCDIKSLNLLPNVLAYTKAERKGCKEALLVRNGIVTEGSHSNFFLVKSGTLYTHPANHLILNGIIRQYILSLANKLQIPVQEELFSIRDVYNADECFFTGTTVEILPMTHLDGIAILNGQVGPTTKLLQKSFVQSFSVSDISLS
ncbi:D-amino-acid transaminase [Bacillus pseudomycoides]|uniref:D-alanine aminotransferase n=1 Tax=Bacillus pseudomycoides TaxID=64104 RepID=A0AA91ZQZ6_9BACI|nr:MULTISPECIES: D-amino-acid transaminase [Bacillus]PEB55903.1 D-amino-acid transaminase [Bacillus sp. AFS098217]PED80140.1 D-amino-acid transaminase [Bacillus pseudomycoides]PEU10418.1 D-amino-acid transaminase [Bacillus sp. AFS019443]PEU18611.1 D-amino-acid transaminase [Bacillus sp. AFS014408]PFW57999.1 D-amino-acid transaminase [Bacillus sp. AFS075034]